MKKLTKIVCTIMIIVGVMGFAPTVEAVSYVWHSDPGWPVVDGRITIDVTDEAWDAGSVITELALLTEFRWMVGSVHYGAWYDWWEISIWMSRDRFDRSAMATLVQANCEYRERECYGLWHNNYWEIELGHGQGSFLGVGEWVRVPTPPEPIPEPGMLVLMGGGLFGVLALRRKVSHKR